MSINKIVQKIKSIEKEISLILALLLMLALGFGLGRLSSIYDQQEPVLIEQLELQANTIDIKPNNVVQSLKQEGEVVGSKNGSKYHYPWCSGAQRILDQNKIWFKSITEAKQAGYTPAANCPGLQ